MKVTPVGDGEGPVRTIHPVKERLALSLMSDIDSKGGRLPVLEN